jgi:exodeoxyribonuclease VII large subunit
MRVRFYCEIDFYIVRGELSLIIKDVDTQFTIGAIAAKREELIRKLIAKGVDKINKRLEVPLVPLRLGIISSSQAAGYIDAIKQLEESGIGFHITLCDVNVQGEAAASQIVAAIQTFSRRSDIDIVMIMRGGGSKGDLAAFDDESMALAISRCKHPVFTGIGHEIDTSIADLVAHTAIKTPTACAQTVIALVEEFYGELSDAAHSLRQLTEHALTRSRARISIAVERLRTRPRITLDRQVQTLAMHAAAVRLLDPAITMARGWSITRNVNGDLVRSISEVSPGEKVVTTLVDGSVTSTVEGVA